MKLAWLTDLPLNFLGDDRIASFRVDLATSEAGAFLISGDIADARLAFCGLLRRRQPVMPSVREQMRDSVTAGAPEGDRLAPSRRLAVGFPGLQFLQHGGQVIR
jgi:hypothetical protein